MRLFVGFEGTEGGHHGTPEADAGLREAEALHALIDVFTVSTQLIHIAPCPASPDPTPPRARRAWTRCAGGGGRAG
jgi:hypothetical protein